MRADRGAGPASRWAGPACLAILLVAALTALPACASVAPPNPGDAPDGGHPYLKRPAATPAAFARQVEADRQLTARYSKHFGQGAAAIWRALRDARPVTLPPGRYTVWLTGRGGLRYPTEQDRTAPTRAFAVALRAPDGQETWLEAGTGCPMERFRPAVAVQYEDLAPVCVQEVATPAEVLVPVGRSEDAGPGPGGGGSPQPSSREGKGEQVASRRDDAPQPGPPTPDP